MKNGGSDYLIKPIDIDELLKSIDIQLNPSQNVL
jgi:DNA-binding response OmpR family regulator